MYYACSLCGRKYPEGVKYCRLNHCKNCGHTKLREEQFLSSYHCHKCLSTTIPMTDVAVVGYETGPIMGWIKKRWAWLAVATVVGSVCSTASLMLDLWPTP